MRIRPTELGIKGMLLLAALELAFLATSYSNLFFLLIAFCCVVGGLGLFGAILNLRRIGVHLTDVPLAAADAERRVIVAFAGHHRHFDLVLDLEGDAGRRHLGHVPLVDGPSLVPFSLAGRGRGVFTSRQLRVSSRFPFGLFEVSRRLPTEQAIVTYPNPIAAEDAARSGRAAARHATASARSATTAGLRPFRTGDSLRDVHWKASARRSLPIVKERETEAGELVEVVLDRRCAAADLEGALSAVAGLTLAARAGGRPMRLHSQDLVIQVGTTGPAAETLLRWLAAAQPLPATAARVSHTRAGCLHLPARCTPEAAHG